MFQLLADNWQMDLRKRMGLTPVDGEFFHFIRGLWELKSLNAPMELATGRRLLICSPHLDEATRKDLPGLADAESSHHDRFTSTPKWMREPFASPQKQRATSSHKQSTPSPYGTPSKPRRHALSPMVIDLSQADDDDAVKRSRMFPQSYSLREVKDGVDKLWAKRKTGDTLAIRAENFLSVFPDATRFVKTTVNNATNRLNSHPDLVARYTSSASPSMPWPAFCAICSGNTPPNEIEGAGNEKSTPLYACLLPATVLVC